MRQTCQCYITTIRSEYSHNTKYSHSSHHAKRFWCWRFWFLSTVATLVICHCKIGDGATSSDVGSAILSFNVTQIASPLSMEALTGVSSDQCKPWAADGTSGAYLTWSNIYELQDVTSLGNYYVDVQYSPTALSVQHAEIENAEGLGFHLSFNATPFCGVSKLPTKHLCNDGLVVAINKSASTVTSGTLTQSLCGGRYFVSYRYTYSCSNPHFSPPSCKTTCRPTSNSTHCYTCDEQDGERRCCAGSAEPECTIVATGAASILSQTSSQGDLAFGGTASTIIIALGVLSALLLIFCLILAALLSCERRKNRQANVAKVRANGCMKNGPASAPGSPHKNGTCPTGNGTVTHLGDASSPIKHNGGYSRAAPVDLDDWRGLTDQVFKQLPTLSSDASSEQRRPASCDPAVVASTGQRRQRLDVGGLYSSTNRNGRLATARARAPLEVIFAAHLQQKHSTIANGFGNNAAANPASRNQLGTLF